MYPYRSSVLPTGHSLAWWSAPRAPWWKRVILRIDFWLRETYFWPFLPLNPSRPASPYTGCKPKTGLRRFIPGYGNGVNTSVLGCMRDRKIRIEDTQSFLKRLEAGTLAIERGR